MPAYQPGESIEGEKVYGHSRDPIRFQTSRIINGIKCFLYKAEFNVYGEVLIGLAQCTPKIEMEALVTEGAAISCDSALVAITAKTRTPRQQDLFQKHISHVTHTHGANAWEPKHQTNIKVITPRQEIINALQKRNSKHLILDVIKTATPFTNY